MRFVPFALLLVSTDAWLARSVPVRFAQPMRVPSAPVLMAQWTQQDLQVTCIPESHSCLYAPCVLT